MSQYKLIALDMDGTLLTNDLRITPKTIAAIHEALEKGYYVVLSTGRAVSELLPYKEELEGIPYYICSSGATIYDTKAMETIHTDSFSKELVMDLFDETADEDVLYYTCTYGDIVFEYEQMKRLEEYHKEIHRELYEQTGTFVEDVRRFYEDHFGSVEKINLYCHSKEHRMHLREKLTKALAEKHPDEAIAVADSEYATLEFTPASATKVNGLHHLCSYLGFTIDDIIAVGDADNDHGMLEAAGFSVAMGNSTPEILKICDAVVADNDHDGVAEAIKTYLI